MKIVIRLLVWLDEIEWLGRLSDATINRWINRKFHRGE